MTYMPPMTAPIASRFNWIVTYFAFSRSSGYAVWM